MSEETFLECACHVVLLRMCFHDWFPCVVITLITSSRHRITTTYMATCLTFQNPNHPFIQETSSIIAVNQNGLPPVITNCNKFIIMLQHFVTIYQNWHLIA